MGMDDLVFRLAEALARVTEGRVAVVLPDQGGSSLRDLGLDSLGLLNFLVEIEDTLAMQWDPETPAGTFRSLETIATYVSAWQKRSEHPDIVAS
jgi:acyl carrier protein